jgi:hypothetical protein
VVYTTGLAACALPEHGHGEEVEMELPSRDHFQPWSPRRSQSIGVASLISPLPQSQRSRSLHYHSHPSNSNKMTARENSRSSSGHLQLVMRMEILTCANGVARDRNGLHPKPGFYEKCAFCALIFALKSEEELASDFARPKAIESGFFGICHP